MPKIGPNEELAKIGENMEMFEKLIQDKMKHRAASLMSLTDKLGERLVLSPASTRTEYQGCFPGGLVEHSLKVVKLMSELNKTYGANLTADSIVVTGLFHDIGKVGNLETDYYLPKNSDWHNKQGIFFEINPELVNMPVSLRSLYLLQTAGVELTEDEFYAISSIRDRARPGEESLPVSNEPMLAVVLQQAVRVAIHRGRGRTGPFDK